MIFAVFFVFCLWQSLAQSCSENEYLYQDTCLESCPEETISELSPQINRCIECDIQKSFILSADKTSCVCAASTYLNQQRSQCLPCHFSCLTCFGSSSQQCSTCDLESRVTFRNKIGNSCVCQQGYFQDKILAATACQKCDIDCKTCSGPQDSQCIQCAKGKVKNQFGLCVCPNGLIDNVMGQCQCPFSLSADGSCLNPVTRCNFGQVPVARNIARMGSGRQRNNSSQCECPAGLNRIKGRCAACGPNEEYNAKNGRCTCVKSAVKFQKTCVLCPQNQRFNRRTGQCSCRKNQQKTDSGQCIRCPAKSVYVDGSCKCIANFYSDRSGRCRRCTRRSDNPECLEEPHQRDRPERLTVQAIRKRKK